MIEWLSDPPNHYVQTFLRSKVALAGPASFLQMLRELALHEVFRELGLRVLSE